MFAQLKKSFYISTINNKQKHKTMTNYLKFNRHEEMKGNTISEILDLIRNPKLESIENYLYGLFDGYFYYTKINEMIQNDTLDMETRTNLVKLYLTIDEYKTLN